MCQYRLVKSCAQSGNSKESANDHTKTPTAPQSGLLAHFPH
ncbi:hypothetical protein [Inoviridae sp.]|nr:hypothetical protein [Inoviridae sp.]